MNPYLCGLSLRFWIDLHEQSIASGIPEDFKEISQRLIFTFKTALLLNYANEKIIIIFSRINLNHAIQVRRMQPSLLSNRYHPDGFYDPRGFLSE